MCFIPEDHIKFFADRSLPVVIRQGQYREEKLEFNGELRRVGFQKVFEPYSAFQEIDMFVSGVMVRPQDNTPSKRKHKLPNPVDINDKDMRDKKGFDDRSFKKPPTKKR